ncbi:MAG: glycosyltransferase family 39 protein [Bacteroidales bacterium]|nr:glycosyltransferase family 39 protein [Bacteroidales bacterium]
MSLHHHIQNSKFEYFSIIIYLLIFISLFHRLGYQPLYQEEPRRAIIALEMIYNHNFIVPTEFGEYYYKKPPVWNWMIIAGFQIFGTNEFGVRFFSVLSLLVIGILIYLAVNKYINRKTAIYSSLYFLVSADVYFYFSMLGEIDIFYSMITLGMFFSIFHFYEQKRFYPLYLITYLLAAIGFLTKGFPSVVFLILSLGVFLLYKRDFLKLLSIPHLLGILVFLILVGGYFLLYNRYNDAVYYLDLLWSRSSNRTVVEESMNSLLVHLVRFPLDLLKDLLPATVLIVLMFAKGWFRKIRDNKLLEFSFFIFVVNILVYWVSPGARDRYIYMLLPFPIIILSYFLTQNLESGNGKIKIINLLNAIILAFVPIASITPMFLHELKFINGLYIFSISGGIIGILLLITYLSSNASNKLLIMITGLILVRFLYNFIILEHRYEKSDARTERDFAYEILDHSGDHPVFLYQTSICSHNTIFYLEKELERVVSRTEDPKPDDIILANDYFEMDATKYKLIYEYEDPRFKKIRVFKTY